MKPQSIFRVVFRPASLLIGLLCITSFGVSTMRARPVLSDPALSNPAPSNNAQTIPQVDLADLDFAITVGVDSAVPGDVVPFYLTITNLFAVPLESFEVVTTPPTHTTFSLIDSSPEWLMQDTESTPCADGSPPGHYCSYSIDSLLANEAITVTFAVIIDPDIPMSDAPISLYANMFPSSQPAERADPPTGQGPAYDPSDHNLYLPLIE